jgi:hypothetical protein
VHSNNIESKRVTLIKYAPPSAGGVGNFRQGILSASSENFLTGSGSARTVTLSAGTILSIAKGFDSNGVPIDKIVKNPTTLTWTNLPANTEVYLYVNEDLSLGYSMSPRVIRRSPTADLNIVQPVTPSWSVGSGITISANGRIISQSTSLEGMAIAPAIPSSSWYFEVDCRESNLAMVGVARGDTSLSIYPGQNTTSWGYYANGLKYYNGNGVACGTAITDGAIVGIAYNNGSVWVSINGVWQGGGNPSTGANPAQTGLTGDYRPALRPYAGTIFYLPHILNFDPPNALFSITQVGQYYYCPPLGRLYELTSGTGWVTRDRIFVGEAIVGSSSISSVVCYPIMGRRVVDAIFSSVTESEIATNMGTREVTYSIDAIPSETTQSKIVKSYLNSVRVIPGGIGATKIRATRGY